MVKLVRSSIRQSKANYLSIDNLERQIYDQDYGTGSNQYSSSSFDMMNTLMVMILRKTWITKFSDAHDSATTTRNE